ncbi:MAG: hypothetical protein GY940_29270, partial [bacterium]|nr:hypothetical protein [bacterium]
DRKKLEHGFQTLICRHESFRNSFFMNNGEPVQRVHEPGTLTFKIEYLESSEGNANQWIRNFFVPFDLRRAPLLRGALIKLQTDRYILAIDMHHIITDGVSSGILVRDFMALYQGKQLAGLRLQYKDFSGWHQDKMGGEEGKKQEQYWLNRFKGEIPAINLPNDCRRPEIQNFEGNNVSFALSSPETSHLKQLALNENVSMFMLLLALF